MQDKSQKEQVEAVLNRQPEAVRHFLKVAAEEFNDFLPHSLLKNCRERYGLDPKGILAIPYKAVNAPSLGSQFAGYCMTMNYTIQYYVKEGIAPKIVEEEVRRLQGCAMKEMQKKKCTLKETDTWKVFKKIKGKTKIPLFNFNDNHMILLQQIINKDVRAKLNFISSIILPQLRLYPHKLSCNPHQLAAFLTYLSGFTGTLLWNSGSLYHKLNPMPAKGTDAKTLMILWAKNHADPIKLNNGTSIELIHQLFKRGCIGDLIADAGGYFKQSTLETAKELQKLTGKAIVFFLNKEQMYLNEKGKWNILKMLLVMKTATRFF